MSDKYPQRSDEEGQTRPEMGIDHLTVNLDEPEEESDEE